MFSKIIPLSNRKVLEEHSIKDVKSRKKKLIRVIICDSGEIQDLLI